MHREMIDSAVGTATIVPDVPVSAGSKGTWCIIFKAGRIGIKKGGSVRITVPHGFSVPQNKAFFDPGFVTVENGENSRTPPLDFGVKIVEDIFCRLDPSTGHSGAWGRSIFVFIENRDMMPGETFIVTYGNRDYYGDLPYSRTGAVVRELSGPAEFIVAVDPTGKRDAPYSGYIRLEKSPEIMVVPGEEREIIALIDPNIEIKNQKNVHIISLDGFFNPIGTRKMKIPEINSNSLSFSDNRISLKYGDFNVITNPVMSENAPKMFREYNLYWGDIHGHTIHSDGLGDVDGFYSFARDISVLDFCAITDHDDIGPRLSREDWETISDAARRYNIPGKFVTFVAHEYRNGKCDMNVYFPGDRGEVFYGNSEEFRDPKNLAKAVKKYGGMIIPHMHFGADLSGFEPEIYRVMEIYSSHGSAEYKGCKREIPYLRNQVQKSNEDNFNAYFLNLLDMGLKLGVTAGSDTHSGRPGLSDWTRVTRTYRGGLTAIYAVEKTREAIWDALYDRRCYATTGNRSVLYFALNEFPMGAEVPYVPNKDYVIFSEIFAHGALESVSLYRNGELSFYRKISGDHYVMRYHEESPAPNIWYYIRYDMAGGEMVWSSPIWIV